MNSLTFNVNLLLSYDDAIKVATVIEREARQAKHRAEQASLSGHNRAVAKDQQQLAADCERIAADFWRAIQGTANRMQDMQEAEQ